MLHCILAEKHPVSTVSIAGKHLIYAQLKGIFKNERVRIDVNRCQPLLLAPTVTVSQTSLRSARMVRWWRWRVSAGSSRGHKHRSASNSPSPRRPCLRFRDREEHSFRSPLVDRRIYWRNSCQLRRMWERIAPEHQEHEARSCEFHLVYNLCDSANDKIATNCHLADSNRTLITLSSRLHQDFFFK